MQSLEACKKDYEVWAQDVDYESMSKNELMDKLKDAKLNNDEGGQVKYLSALMLKYWYKINLMWKDWDKKHMSRLEDKSDILCWVKQGILEALDSYIKYGDSKLTPEKMIERCCYQVFVSNCRYYELDIHKANIFNISLDLAVSACGKDFLPTKTEGSDTPTEVRFVDMLKSSDDSRRQYYKTHNFDIIHHFNSNNELCKAIVVDLITNYDVIAEKSSRVNKSSIANFIKNIDYNYEARYYYIYNVDIANTVNILKKLTDSKLAKLISKTVESIKKDSYVRGLLC